MSTKDNKAKLRRVDEEYINGYDADAAAIESTPLAMLLDSGAIIDLPPFVTARLSRPAVIRARRP
jgi:hypothetical protein